MDIKKALEKIDEMSEGWDDEYPDYDDDGFNHKRFAQKGSALHTATENDPRDQPCPTCGEEDVLTRRDVARGYQCDDCADRAEGRMQYESKKPSLKNLFNQLSEDSTAGMKPFAVLDPKTNKPAGAAVLKSPNKSIQDMLKGVNPRDLQIVMTQQGTTPSAGTTSTQTTTGAIQPMKEASDSEPTVNGKVVDIYSLDFEDIDTKDYPDFADAYVVSGSFEDGSKMSDADLEKFQDEHRDLVHRLIHDRIYEGSISKIARNKNKIDEISKAKVLKHIKAADKKAVELGKQGVEKYKQGDREGGAADLARSGKYYKMSSPHAGLGHKKLAGVGVKVPATGAEPVEVQYVITKIGRTPGKKSGLGGQTIHGVEIKDVYTDKAEAEKHAAHLGKYNPVGYEVVRVVERDQDMLESQLNEKWGTETKVAPSEKGKYKGKTKAELLKRYNKLKKSGPHKKGSKEYGTMRELSFAIRAKSGWGKVKEAEIPSDQMDMGAGLGAGRSNLVLESNMKKTCEAAYHEGMSHGLGGHSYTCRYDEGTDEHMHYHKGFKEGLDECYGISPMRGVVDEAAKWREHPGAHYHDDDNILPVGFDEPEDPLAARQNYLQTAKDYISKRVKNPERARQMAQQYAKTGMKDFKEEDEGLPATVPGMASQAMDECGMMEDDMDEGVIGGLAGGAIGARLGGVSGAMTGYKLGSAAQDMFQKEGNAFTGALANTKKGGKFSLGGHTYTDTSDLEEMAFESLDRQLNALLNEGSVSEGISVSISKGNQGGQDTVSVTATDTDADNLLSLVRNAGMGVFADEEKASDYGAPVSHEGHAEVEDHGSVLDIMKKMAGIEHRHASGDYEQEDDHGDCGCGQTPCGCDQIDEEESEDQMEYEVAEDAATDAEEQETTADEKTGAEEDEALAKADQLDEWANDAGKIGTEEAFTTTDDFMLDTISSGLNKKKSTGQTTIPVIAGQKDRMGYNESISDWIKLAGIK